jgi:hypothetical protein
MFLAVDIWVLPAISAAASSYLVSLVWERLKPESAPGGMLAGLLAGLSFLMGAICSYYRGSLWAPGLENNTIVMFIAGASSTYFWLLLRKYLPGFAPRKR